MGNARLDVTGDWETICRHLPSDFRELADEYKQVQTQFGNAKIRTADDLLRLALLHVGADLPLRQTVALMAEAGGPSLSHVRLHKKMFRATPYFRALVRSMVNTTPADPERWAGYEVVTVDASGVCGPGAENMDARLHVQMRITDLDFLTVRVEGLAVAESFQRFNWKPGQLAVGDRGYCRAPGISWVVMHGADVLVRVGRTKLTMSDEDGVRVDLMEWLRTLRGYEAAERPVLVHDRERDRDVRGRLIAVRLPEAQAAKARARWKRDHTGKMPDIDRESAAYVVLFTTVPKSKLDSNRCLDLYRLRWQIELLFKRWKSLCGFDRLPNYLDETITAWLYAKVLLALVMQRMGACALSPPEPTDDDGWRSSDHVESAFVEARLDPVASDSLGPAALRSA
jgi:hypothetical protein